MNIPHTHFTSLLKEKLRLPLPGEVAQFKMAHAARYSLATVAPATAKVASVMILLFPKEENTHFILIERVQTAGDAHSGQISFPGGKRDFSDIDLAQTALRRTTPTPLLLPCLELQYFLNWKLWPKPRPNLRRVLLF